MSVHPLTRRGLLRGSLVALVGAAGGYLAVRGSTAARGVRGSTVANAYRPPEATGSRRLVALADVPVGGGVVLAKESLVVTRPAPDEVHAFSAVCTHQGCTVDAVADGTIDCPCHGSRFDAATGEVRRGPAARPLAPVAVVVRSGEVVTS
jgi:Rieske Fe-S protein